MGKSAGERHGIYTSVMPSQYPLVRGVLEHMEVLESDRSNGIGNKKILSYGSTSQRSQFTDKRIDVLDSPKHINGQ